MRLFDFRLKVFFEVAQRLSFTKAASVLNITQPAVSKHIQEMEHQLDKRLFRRGGNRIKLTEAGQVMFGYAQRIMHLYEKLDVELSQLDHETSGILRLGASTTVAQTVVPRLLALYKKAYPDVEVRFSQGDSDYIMKQILNEGLDLGIIEGGNYQSSFSYTPFMKDEMVLVTSSENSLTKTGAIRKDQLYTIPLVLRQAGSGSLDVVFKALTEIGIDTNKLLVDIQLESTIAIKEYLQYADSAAFLSIQSVIHELKTQQLSIIDIEGLEITRAFQFIQLHGNHTKLIESVKRFYLQHYNHK